MRCLYLALSTSTGTGFGDVIAVGTVAKCVVTIQMVPVVVFQSLIFGYLFLYLLVLNYLFIFILKMSFIFCFVYFCVYLFIYSQKLFYCFSALPLYILSSFWEVVSTRSQTETL